MGLRMRVETMPKKKYSDEFKADAVALYETHPGLLKVWLTPGFMPPGRRPCGEQARIQPGSVYPNVAVDASGDRSARPSGDRKSTRLNSSHVAISYAVFCLKKK